MEEGREAHALPLLITEQPQETKEQSLEQIEQTLEQTEQSQAHIEQSQRQIEQSPELVGVGDLEEGREAHSLHRVHAQPLEHVLKRLLT